MYVDFQKLLHSVHPEFSCIDCHEDAEELHESDLERVNCAGCHFDEEDEFLEGIHGQKFVMGNSLAPSCQDCHGTHEILPPSNPLSSTYKMNIPMTCGQCHREGEPVARNLDISQHNIIENYTQSIHGEGLFKSGLIVTATCNDCHGNHKILPHSEPESSISVENIANTCMTCHSRIEEVHQKVIKGELWESKPGAIPACSDCHPPHELNRQNLVVEIADRTCLECHAAPDVHKMVNGEVFPLFVDQSILSASAHENITCVKCHSDVSTSLGRPCETTTRVNCSNCHAEVAEMYGESGHGMAFLNNEEDAPYCTDCHGSHDTLSKDIETSATYRANIPQLCGECHQEDNSSTRKADLKETNAMVDYSQSVHGKGLMEKGLLPSAVCTDCHTSHHNLRDTDIRSSVHPKNIPNTCAQCHSGIFKEYESSVHNILMGDGDKQLPTCADCHSAHTITATKEDQFMIQVTHQCGSCHEDLSDTYLETIHGKSYELGHENAAKCSDCHGSHSVHGVDDPNSTISPENILNTCQQCHENANSNFTGYLTHATHSDRENYPSLYYAFWAMTSLLIGVFGFFGIHTLLWLPRSIQGLHERKNRSKEESNDGSDRNKFIRRFTLSQRVTHLCVIISFMALALTGMVLKFAHMEWAQILANLMGGARSAATIHRFAAVLTFAYFFYHAFSLFRIRARQKKSWKSFIFGKNSMMFNLQDLKDFGATLKWFFGLAPRPDYGRWTYWEKFDYFAVVWGVAIIGLSGLMLWFPEFFTQFLPGWIINIAHIIHSDEALLAVGFIFTVHFFNTHFRPSVFPVDTVIFTGMLSLEEFKRTRPREYEELKASGKLEETLIEQELNPKWEQAVRIFGLMWLFIGMSLVGLIIYSLLQG